MSTPKTITQEGYRLRPTTQADFDSVLALVRAYEEAINGYPMTTAHDLRHEWDEPDFDITEKTRVAVNDEGQLIGYVEVFYAKELPVRPSVWICQHPDHEDLTVGQALYHWAEECASLVLDLVPSHAKVTLVTSMDSRHTARTALYESVGLTQTGQVWQKMLIEMDAMPDAPTWDDGVTVITSAELNDARAVFEAHQDSFKDHRNYVERNRDEYFKQWSYFNLEDTETYDPTLWFLAMVDGQIAGISLCHPYHSGEPDEGYVAILGVRREYRGRGIAKALLIHSFREYWKRDKKKVSLVVDGSSITGANRLYMSAGMSVARTYETWEKVLRDGEELSVQ
jgi:mycothiol synthase